MLFFGVPYLVCGREFKTSFIGTIQLISLVNPRPIENMSERERRGRRKTQIEACRVGELSIFQTPEIAFSFMYISHVIVPHVYRMLIMANLV